MIEFIRGSLTQKAPHRAIVDQKGIGLEILIPFSSFGKLPATGQEVSLLTHLIWREDGPQLFGFMTEAERALFRLLNKVNKVGPKLALNIMSGVQPEKLAELLITEDIAALRGLKGVGPKLASRLVLELKEPIMKLGLAAESTAKVTRTTAKTFPQEADVRAALETLGYTTKEISKAISDLSIQITTDTPLQDILEEILHTFSQPGK